MTFKQVWLWAVACLLALSFGLPARAQESRFDVVIKRDKLIVATYSTAPPLAFTDEKGQLVGFEIDLVRIIAKDLLGDPNKVEFMIVQSEGRFPSVLSGRADFAIAATTIYPERAAKVAFTTPYMDSGTAVLVRRDANVRNLADLNNEKFTITGQNNPQNAERAKRFVPKAKTIWFDNPSELLLAVKSNRATAMQTDVPIADYFALQNKELLVLPDMVEKLGVANNAIFMKPGDFTWWLFLDTAVKEMRYGSRYQEYTDLFRKWFGKDPPPQRFYINPTK
jgi:polar amino acid transport system substrate-binding protein